jgi:hypothetical protein
MADDQNASMTAAIKSMTAAPNTMTLVSLAASSKAALRVNCPGSNTDRPTRKPAAPQSTIAVSSNAECVATNGKKAPPNPSEAT